MFDLGMPTLLELPTVEDCAKVCQELGLQFVELNMNLPPYQLDGINTARFREIARNYGIYYTIHLDENLNVSDFNPYVAAAYLRTVTETIEIAKRLDAPILNMHLSKGVYFTLPAGKVFLYNHYTKYYLQSMETFRNICENAMQKSDSKLCIENTDGYEDFQVRALSFLLKSPAFALTMDIGHNHSTGGTDEVLLMRRKDRLCHFHFHDAAGTKNHLPLGCGDIDLPHYFQTASDLNSRIVLETKTVDGLKQSVDWIRRSKYICGLWRNKA